VNFKDYFYKENFEDKSFDPYLKMGTGSAHHQTVGRVTKMGERKKGLHLIAKSQSQKKKTLHPKIDLCLKIKKNVPLVGNEPVDIMKKYHLCPTPEEPSKAIKQMPVSLNMIKPNVYILTYRGE
jgi:hypothetical protein